MRFLLLICLKKFKLEPGPLNPERFWCLSWLSILLAPWKFILASFFDNGIKYCLLFSAISLAASTRNGSTERLYLELDYYSFTSGFIFSIGLHTIGIVFQALQAIHPNDYNLIECMCFISTSPSIATCFSGLAIFTPFLVKKWCRWRPLGSEENAAH